MSSALTESSTVACGHQGQAQLRAGQSKLTVGGSKVLVDGDLSGAMLSGCTTPTNPVTGTKQCLTVSSALGGVATKLTVGGKGVLLDQIAGTTDGLPAPNWSVQSANQTKLQTV